MYIFFFPFLLKSFFNAKACSLYLCRSCYFVIRYLVSECQVLDKLEKSSRTVKGANFIGQDNEALSAILLPFKTWSKGSPVSLR